MPAEVIMPALGMAQDFGIVLRWLRAEGDQVSAGEALLEVETDKATVELESPIDGTLSRVRAVEGDQVPVGEVIAVVLAAGEQPAEPTQPRQPAPEPAATPVPHAAPIVASPQRRSRLASPKARRIAAEHAIDLDRIQGSGPGGAIVAADVAGTQPSAGAPATVSRAWRIMAERTTASWTPPGSSAGAQPRPRRPTLRASATPTCWCAWSPRRFADIPRSTPPVRTAPPRWNRASTWASR